MADESALEHPAEVYNPFDADEIERLTTYKDDVERWTSMAFFTDPTRSLGPKKPGEERTIRLADVDEEAAHAAMGIFRSLYTGTEPTSFRKTMNLLKRHVRPSARRQEALHDLGAMQDWEKKEIARTPIKIVRGEQEFTPEANIKAHLHGVFLHKDPARRRELEPFPDGLLRGEMLGKVYALAQVYWIGRNIVAPILEEPSLRHPQRGIRSSGKLIKTGR
jgi:hypothetical protein